MEKAFWCIFWLTAIGIISYAVYLFIKKRQKFFDFIGNLLIATAGFALAAALLWRQFNKAELDERYHECNVLLMMQKEFQRKIIAFDQLALLFSFIDSSLTEKKLIGSSKDEAIVFHLSNELSLFMNDFRYESFYDPSTANLFKPGFFYIIDSLVSQIRETEELIERTRNYAEQYQTIASISDKHSREIGLIKSYYDHRVRQIYLKTQVVLFFPSFRKKHEKINAYYRQLCQEIDKRYEEVYLKYPDILIQIREE
jgi:hypothetical protein